MFLLIPVPPKLVGSANSAEISASELGLLVGLAIAVFCVGLAVGWVTMRRK